MYQISDLNYTLVFIVLFVTATAFFISGAIDFVIGRDDGCGGVIVKGMVSWCLSAICLITAILLITDAKRILP